MMEKRIEKIEYQGVVVGLTLEPEVQGRVM